MITLVALLAVTTGAWADQLASSYSSNATLNAVTVSASMEVTIATGVTVTINNGLNITSGTLTVKGPGTLVVNGKAGSNGYNGGPTAGGAGGTGSAAITGNIIVQGGATVKATGGNGGNGGNSEPDDGGNGAQGGAAITGDVTIQDASTLEATGGNGGNGGNGEGEGGKGGNGANAIGGTLTYKGGAVTATGGNGGSGGAGGAENGSGGSAGKAFTTSVNFVSSDYILTDGSNAITTNQVTSKKKVVINPKVAVNSVTLGKTTAELTIGDYLALTATIDPTNAMDPTVKWNVTAGAEKVKLYKDENCSTEVGTAATDVLTVYAKGLVVGEATVTVTSNDDATKTAACTVTVIPSGPKVAWTAASNTGTFKMPGGNVTLEPEYYPQAALTAAPTAINDVPATTDGAIVKAGTVANIGETTTAQGTVMYYVSPTALDDAALLALAADKWTANVPTAESLAEGPAYVYYYVRGNDSDNDEENFSDGDILAANALSVTIAPEPTYAVTFAEGTDANEWKAEPNTAKKGQQVTVTYEGPRKVMGVKAEKKKVAEGHALSASAVGEIVGTDGKAYAAADKDNLPSGVTAVAMVAYKSETTGSSLAIALADESNSDWNTAKSTCEGKSAVTDAAWLLPSQNQWKAMFSANGGNEGQYTGLNTAITTAGGTALQGAPPYWSSTPSGYDDGTAYNVLLGGGGAEWYRDFYEETRYRVRACLAF